MISGGFVIGDGSWELRIFVTDLQIDRTLRVKGDMHIGGVMLKLVEELDIATDWSDHALWWQDKNMWLSRSRSTLDQYGVQADALLQFTPMHKALRVQLPDLRYIDCRVNFSTKMFNSVVHLCKELTIRYPEELSLCRPLQQDLIKKNRPDLFHTKTPSERQKKEIKMANDSSLHTINSLHLSTNSLDRTGRFTPTSPGTPNMNNSGTWRGRYSPYYNGGLNGSHSPASLNSLSSVDGGLNSSLDMSLSVSPHPPSVESKLSLVRPRSLAEKARLNVAWLDSSLSLMEQNVRDYDTLHLRFKYFSFYDLNPKYDAVRINQIYEQAKWAVLAEEIDCTEEEMILFAALQLQVNMQAQVPQPQYQNGHDDIDAALTDLQITLEGTNHITSSLPINHHKHIVGNNITQIPELADYLKFMKPKKFTLKGFKTYYFVFKDTGLSYYKSREDTVNPPLQRINMRGCEVTPDVIISQRKYGIKLEVPSGGAMEEIWIRCNSESQYAKWMAACKLASKGKTMADSSYDNEVSTIQELLSLQHPAPAPAIHTVPSDIDVDDYVAHKFLKKIKTKQQVLQRILEAHTNVKDLNSTDAKLNFIRAWQALPDYGIRYFVIKFAGSKKEEVLAITTNRLMRMDVNTGDHLKTWRLSTLKGWRVNWEVKQVMVDFEDGKIIFGCLSADCKVVHEFIGGYLFLSMRSKDQNQTLNEELFHKLTGGWD